jgi:hypothetical protein
MQSDGFFFRRINIESFQHSSGTPVAFPPTEVMGMDGKTPSEEARELLESRLRTYEQTLACCADGDRPWLELLVQGIREKLARLRTQEPNAE